ncbi:hypothetical protein RHGRI_006035 [Rhododendron griersonianum]|uniref:PB1 domain-containing protein n=1 Tax=Rhododendron griersonianum TaxID=479676 RepID=A0AAV6LHP2_9ERIC|nr:hypothetical protein RHGRI_006035 [Rhododendron griersonianum]
MPIHIHGSVDDAHTILLGIEEDYFSPDFKEYLLKERLYGWRFDFHPLWELPKFGWVFWSQLGKSSLSFSLAFFFLLLFLGAQPQFSFTDNSADLISPALQKLIRVLKEELRCCLVQFWAATKTSEGRTLLTTQFQPFALGPTSNANGDGDGDERNRLCSYRMGMCREYNNSFYADAECAQEQLGLPGRVFLNQLPESTPHVKHYTLEEYPQRDLALRCKIRSSVAVPVFEPSSRTCVGVLEIVSLNGIYWLDKEFLGRMYNIFQEFGLQCFDGYEHCKMQYWDKNEALTAAFQELKMVYKSVCTIHKLPMALTWVSCSSCNDLLQSKFQFTVRDYCHSDDIGWLIWSSNFLGFARFSNVYFLKKGQVTGRILPFPNLLYCSDVKQLSIAEFPLVPFARRCKLGGWFTMCLQSGYTEDELYVLEFFLPESDENDENILTKLRLILGTMEEYFKTFKLASGQGLGEALSVEVIDFQNGQKSRSIQIIPATRCNPGLEPLHDGGVMLQQGQQDQPSILLGVEELNHFPPDFKEYIQKEQLNWSRFERNLPDAFGWVFWSQLGKEYNNSFYADADSREEQLGLPGRVFLNKLPESTPDVKYYTLKEYPQRDLALRCEIESSWALPVFEHSSRTCVGVLEIVSPYGIYRHDKEFLGRVYDIFQEFGLRCFDGYEHCKMQYWDKNEAPTAAFQELKMVYKAVCIIHNLPFALSWVSCHSGNDLLQSQFQFSILDYSTDKKDYDDFLAFANVSKACLLKKGQVTGRILPFPNLLYCSDVKQFSIAEFPLVPYARWCELGGWFTMCIQSGYTGDELYVLEFFLPKSTENDENILTKLRLILGTMEKNFETFKLASGQGLGEALSVEVIDFQNGQKSHSIQMIPASRCIPGLELLQDGGVMLQQDQQDQPSMDVINSGMYVVSEAQNYNLPILDSLQNGKVTKQVDSSDQHVAHIKPSFQDADMVTIRATCEKNTIKFRLSLSSRLIEMQQEVAKRLNLEGGTYYIKYKDEEDVILIACDEDLQDCLHTSRSLGISSIAVLLELK